MLKPEDNPHAFERGCLGKVRYPSEASALAVASMAHQGKIYGDLMRRDEWELLTAYLCEFSEEGEPHWHLGHNS